MRANRQEASKKAALFSGEIAGLNRKITEWRNMYGGFIETI